MRQSDHSGAHSYNFGFSVWSRLAWSYRGHGVFAYSEWRAIQNKIMNS
jgi:hypothetical protein